MTTVLIFILLEVLLTLCIFLLPQLTFVWAIALAICPLLLLAFWKKATLPASQNTYSVVFALAYGALTVFCGSSANASSRFFATSGAVFWVAFLGIVAAAALFGSLLGNTTKKHYRLFVFGVLFSVAYVCIPQNSAVLCAVAFALLLLAIVFVTASAISLHKLSALAAIALGEKDVSPQLLARNVAFVATTVNLFFVLTGKFCAESGVVTADLWANIVCAVMSFVLLFVYLRQPLEDVSEYQISLLQQDNPDVDKDLVRKQLEHRLKAEPFYPLAAFLKKSLALFFHDKVVGLEKVEESTVFVANHYEIYGPFIVELKFPRAFRPWTDSLMTDRATLTRQLRSGINVVTRKWLIKPIREKLPAWVASPLWKILNCCRPISIYRRDAEKIDQMFNDSVTALKSGDNVVIFPEKPPTGQHYGDGTVDKFQTGFVEIAERFKQETGKNLTFYPLYVDKYGKKMVVGEKVTYNPDALLRDEKVRIADELYDQMTAISQECEKQRKK